MPIDPSIPLAVRSPQVESPIGLMQGLQQMQLQRQSALALQAEREMNTQKTAIALQDNDAYKQAIQGSAGMTPEQLLERVRTLAPKSYLDVQKAIDEAGAKAAAAKESTAKAAEAQALAAQHQQDYIGHLAYQVSQSGYDPAILNVALNDAVQHFPDWQPHADQIRQMAMAQGKAGVQAALQPFLSVSDQKTGVETTNAAAQTPGIVAETGQKVRGSAGALLGSATSAQDYAAKLGTLDPATARLFPPPQAWTPKLAPTIQRIGMNAEQQASTATAQQNTAISAARLAEEQRHNTVTEGFQDPANPKRQEALEQQYRGVLQREMSSRSGGLGTEDQKVNQAIHLTALMDQGRDPKTGLYNIPRAQYAELAMGLASLISPQGRPSDSARQEIETRTAKGDLNGALTYITGTPLNGSTQDIYKMLRDSIDRQGRVAEQNRQGYFDALKAQAPTDLAPERRAQLEQSLKLNSLSRGGLIYAKDPQGNIHSAQAGTALPAGWVQVQQGGGR